MDALLPRRLTSIGASRRKPLGPAVSSNRPPSVTHTDIKKDDSGRMLMVRHKQKAPVFADGDGAVTTQDVKKNRNGNANCNANGSGIGRGIGKKGGNEATNQDGEKAWTPEDDAKLKEMKADGKTWAQIAEELGRAKHEGQARFKEINTGDNAGSGGGAGGGEQKKNEKGGKGGKGGKNSDNAKEEKQEGGDAGGADFTVEDDTKVKELLATSTGYKKIAEALGRTLDKTLKDHIGKLKAEDGDAGGEGGDEKKEEAGRKGRKGDDGGKQKKQNEGLEKKKDKLKKKEKSSNEDAKKKEKHEKSSKEEEAKSVGKAASHVGSHRSEAKFTMGEWMTLQEDDMFSFGELQLLSELLMKDGGQSWLRVASAFMDKTGRRVHPEDIRDKFEQLRDVY